MSGFGGGVGIALLLPDLLRLGAFGKQCDAARSKWGEGIGIIVGCIRA